jgi:ABC-type transport system involved in multi-copper enzyme maturation permease subunit
VLTIEEMREIFGRRRSLISLVLYVVFLGLMLSSFRSLAANASRIAGTDDLRGRTLDSMLEQLNNAGATEAAEILMHWPFAVITFQILCLFCFPSLVSLVSCDMISTDSYRGTLRLLLLRSSRQAYYLSKLIAHVSVYMLLQIVSLLALFLICVTATDFSTTGFLEASLHYVAVFIPFMLFLVSGTELVSGFCRRPATALFGVHILWIVLLTVTFRFPDFTPFHWRALLGLVLPSGEYLIDSIVRMGIWTVGFTALGLGIFLRREL